MSYKPLPAQMSDDISKAGDMAIASYLDLLQSRIGPLDLDFPQSPGAAEDAFNRIERELEANKRAVRVIGHRRNALLPILNRVPSEVLTLVFSWLSQLKPFATTQSSNRNIGWAKVTHVCQEFRRIALESPSLWTNITDDFASTPWCQIHIQRSRQVPLSLRLSSSRNIPTSSLVVILASGRVMELDLGPSSKPHIPEVAAFLLNPPATLCHLHARGVLTRSRRYKMVLFDDNRTLPLRSLRLSLVDFRWTTIGTFAQLSRLYLEGFDPEKHPAAASSLTNKFGSWISFNDCMGSLPHLTSLVLRYCLPDSEFEYKGPIDMTELEELYIVDRAEETLHSLSIIAVPEEARLQLRCLIRENTREDIIQTLVNKFFEHLVFSPTPAQRLLISESSRRYRAKALSKSRRLRPAIHEPTPSSAMYADKALSSIFLHFPGPRVSGPAAISRTLIALNTTQEEDPGWLGEELEELAVESDSSDWTAAAWSDVSERLGSVEILDIGRAAVRTLCKAFAMKFPSPMPSGEQLNPQDILFPHLVELYLSNSDLRSSLQTNVGDAPDMSALPMDLLRDGLSRRPEYYIPSMLHIGDCDISSIAIAELDSVLPQELIWDGLWRGHPDYTAFEISAEISEDEYSDSVYDSEDA